MSQWRRFIADEDAALRGEDLPHEVAMDLLRKALNARNHFARRVGELRTQLPVTPGDYPMPFNDYMAPAAPMPWHRPGRRD